ncbi:uncharacterized protein N7511_007984 [Penicillium nucicola]|uniref:uncharacterized protein n=1 Tax=Penicillium nucicola TaxID=1850975 RepID=UPI0025458A7A|nr:uncharacterized protein N7511_007984 [Penicillium nucicola]KAJ5753831.1 hypothetical protein N7511_007984 [Penicillium nucicola]
MSAPSSTEGSPADQLAAFAPNSFGGDSQRALARLPGNLTTRTSDPFSGWHPGITPERATISSGFLQARGSSFALNTAMPSVAFPDTPSRYSSAQFGGSVSGTPDFSGADINLSSPSRYSPTEIPRSSVRPGFRHDDLYSPSQSSFVAYSPSRADLTSPLSQGFLNRLIAASSATSDPSRLDPVLPAFPRSTSAQSLTNVSDMPSLARPLLATDNQRGFTLYGVHANSTHWSILENFLPSEYHSVDSVYLGDLQTRGRVSVLFTDLRDMTRAIDRIRLSHPEWVVDLASPQQIASITKNFDIPSTSNTNDGKLMVTVHDMGKRLTQNHHALVERLIRAFGDVKLFKLYENGPVSQSYRVEFYNTRHTSYAFSCLQGFKHEFLTFEASFNRPQCETSETFHVRTPSINSQHVPVTPEPLSSSIDTTPAKEDPNAENTIDMDRIQRGLDVRSTIMIRNIPNKITSNELKIILDESSFGKYDFMYLRMDFNHGCNVGYAFINFGDPMDILDLIMARHGKTWPECISEKKAQISYAALQGKDALISKFRNSHVMTRPAGERPRLFHIGGPRSGSDAPFPPPNDASKLRRSVASTTQQGKTFFYALSRMLELTLVQGFMLLILEKLVLPAVAVALTPELAINPSAKPAGLVESEHLLDKARATLMICWALLQWNLMEQVPPTDRTNSAQS